MSTEKADEMKMVSESSSSMPCYLTEEEKKMNEDYEWCLNDPDVRRQYGGQVVAAHQRRIWGVGANHLDALDAALQEPGCPHRKNLVFVVVPPLLPVASYPPPSGT
jgi:hypothetical protein